MGTLSRVGVAGEPAVGFVYFEVCSADEDAWAGESSAFVGELSRDGKPMPLQTHTHTRVSNVYECSE